MFGLFQRTFAPLADFSVLEVDFHSHLLPGIDDGSPDMNTSLNLIRGMQALGFRKLITTPHVMSDFYPNTREIILRKKTEVQEALEEMGMEISFDAAAEYYIDETFAALLKKEPLLTLPGNRVLIEMSFQQAYIDLHRVVFDLQMKGYHPIMAHPERYPYLRSIDDYENLKTMGCQLQLNLLSLTGYYGKPVQQSAKMLLQNDLVDYIASDLHHERHAAQLRQALSHEFLIKALSKHAFLNKTLG